MLENVQTLNGNDVGDENTNFQRAYLTGRLGGVKVEAGRNHVKLVGGDSDVYENRVDHIKFMYGDKFKVAGWYGKPTALNNAPVAPAAYNTVSNYSKFAGARLSYDWNKFGLFAEYDKFSGKHRPFTDGRNNNRDILGIGLNAKFGDFGLNALYLHGNIKERPANQPNKKNGFTLGLNYKGAKAAKVGSWGLAVKYYDQGNATYFAGRHGIEAIEGAFFPQNIGEGFKGFRVSADYTVAKNMVAKINYIDLKGKSDPAAGVKKNARTIYTQMIFTF
jgi:predicted porin